MIAHLVVCACPDGQRLYLTGEFRWSADLRQAALICDHPGYNPQVHGVYAVTVEDVHV